MSFILPPAEPAFTPFETHHRRIPAPRTNYCAVPGVPKGRIKNFVENRIDLVGLPVCFAETLFNQTSLWLLAVRSSSNGIPPNTNLGFRTEHTLASAQGWYAAQPVGFHLAAVADSVITVAVFAIVAVLYIRRFNPRWILVVPVIGGIAVAVCFVIAGHYADQAATSTATTPQALKSAAATQFQAGQSAHVHSSGSDRGGGLGYVTRGTQPSLAPALLRCRETRDRTAGIAA